MQRSLEKFFVSLAIAPLALGVLLFSASAYGDSVRMQPELLNLSTANPLANLYFHNESAEETTLTFEVAEWQQQGDREWLTPTGALIMVPTKLTLKPGESEKVRVSLRLSGSFWDEEAFRILVTQKTPIPNVGEKSALDYQGRISRPLSVPVFLQPPGNANPRVTWSFSRSGPGSVVLRASNNGKGHVQMNSASLLGPDGQSIQKPQMTDIILPGGARSWEFYSYAAAGDWHLIADTNAGPMRVKLELQPEDAPSLAYRSGD